MVNIGLVVIGRNEGSRLRQSLLSATAKLACQQIVYVDSGSTDDSKAIAQGLGADVVDLDLAIPFTAARARNEGFAKLLRINPALELVQFVDGDCEIQAAWLDRAQAEFESRPDVAVVCGRRRERFPEASIYNRLCDIEWDTEIGEADACGGDAMMRVSAFQQVQGFNPGLIAGEEPDLCLRMRQKGWKILRIDAEMTLHDAQMTRFSQWWKRMLRSGHAYAEGAWLHGKEGERHWVRESLSIWFWGLLLPLFSVCMLLLLGVWAALLLSGYLLSGFRVYQYGRKRNYPPAHAILYALACTLGKFPQWQGQAKFLLNRFTKRPSQLIEYKSITNTIKF